MKTSKTDKFDLKYCIRGLGNVLTYMHSDMYEYCYYLTFKRSMKDYQSAFNNAWENVIEEAEFFADSKDLYVKICSSARFKIVLCKRELSLRWGIDEQEDLEDDELIAESKRYLSYFLMHKRSKSYKRLNLFAIRTLGGFIDTLYAYCCALTVQSYKIPLVMKKQFKMGGEDSLRLLNEDENNIDLLTQLIIGLKQDLKEYTLLVENKGKPLKIPQEKTAVV